MKRLSFFCVAFAFVAFSAEASSKRLTVIVSDLHLNTARHDPAFTHFLGEISGGSTTLILNGDTFELGDDALSTLEQIFEAQSFLLDRLEIFASKNEVVIVPGDADSAVAVPAVADRIRKRLGNIQVASGSFWRSDDGLFLVEHGHQIPRANWREHVGDELVIEGFAARLAGLKYGLAIEPRSATAELLKLLLLNVSWGQFRRDLEQEVESPEWNVKAIRESGDAFLRESIPEDDPLYQAWQQTTLSASELTDDEVRLVCDYRAAIRRARRRMERGLTQLARVGPVVAECPRLEHTRDPSFSYFWSSRDRLYEKRFQTFESLPSVYVHGHTHLADRGSTLGNGVRLLDTGAFQRVITPARFEASRERRGVTRAELLDQLQPDGRPPCYSYVVIEPYEETPQPQLTYWQQTPDGSWGVGRRCEM